MTFDHHGVRCQSAEQRTRLRLAFFLFVAFVVALVGMAVCK